MRPTLLAMRKWFLDLASGRTELPVSYRGKRAKAPLRAMRSTRSDRPKQLARAQARARMISRAADLPYGTAKARRKNALS